MSALILFRSLTYAQRALNTMAQGGIPGKVTKAPAGLSDRGCTYAILVAGERLQQTLDYLEEHSVPYNRVFIRDRDGRYREARR